MTPIVESPLNPEQSRALPVALALPRPAGHTVLPQTIRRLALPLLLVAVVNVAGFLFLSRVNGLVGAELGTDGYMEIAENLVAGHGFVATPGVRSIIELGYMKREPLYPLSLAIVLHGTGAL